MLPAMSAEVLVERLHAALEMADTGVELMRQNLRRRHPDSSVDEVDRLLLDWINGRTGDCPGPRRTLPIR